MVIDPRCHFFLEFVILLHEGVEVEAVFVDALEKVDKEGGFDE